tara:strand:- start:510 stop:1190 length:681 start_codon:yes stop_codon:yes gene_type:complete
MHCATCIGVKHTRASDRFAVAFGLRRMISYFVTIERSAASAFKNGYDHTCHSADPENNTNDFQKPSFREKYAFNMPVTGSNYKFSATSSPFIPQISANSRPNHPAISTYVEPQRNPVFMESLKKEISQCQIIKIQTSIAAKVSRAADCLSQPLYLLPQSLLCRLLAQVQCLLGTAWAHSLQLLNLQFKRHLSHSTNPNQHLRTALGGCLSAPVFCVSKSQIGAVQC